MKTILVIAGGKWQIPLVKKLKKMGHVVVCSNLHANSPCFEFADYCEVADVRDKETNLAIARKYNVEAVMTDQSDIAVPTVAYVAEKMNLKTISLELAELFTNKYKMREFLKDKDFPFPEYKICSNIEEAIEFFKLHNKKMIIKPLDSQSSRGIYEINSVEKLKEVFELSKAYSNHIHAVLIERYIQGKEFTVDGLVYKGKHYSLAISEKSHYSFNENIANSLYFSHKNKMFDYKKLADVNDSIITASGLPFGLTHSEYKYEDGKFYLIEMASRGGGTKISSDIVPLLTGIDNYKLFIEELLELKSNPKSLIIEKQYHNRHIVLQFLDQQLVGKRVENIIGIDEILKLPEIIDFGLNIQQGGILPEITDDSNRIGYYIAVASSKDQLRNIKEIVNKTLKVETS